MGAETINDWWNRYVPKREQPQKGMQGYQFRRKPPVEKQHALDCWCYVCRDNAVMEELKRREAK